VFICGFFPLTEDRVVPAPLKIVMVASECVPFAKTGGLADAVGGLAGALRALGHEVIVVMPRYGSIDASRFGLRPHLAPLGVWMGNVLEWCAVHVAAVGEVPFHFVELERHFARPGLYHDADFRDYGDNAFRFGFLTRAALQFCRDVGFAPDVVHGHDWQTALAAPFLRIWHWDDPLLGRAAGVLTIHNVAYQGVYPADCYGYLGLQAGNFVPGKFEDHGAVNLLKGGIQYADLVNTVSPTYAAETRTPAGGRGLAPYLNDKGDRYVGILNGADCAQWDPAADRAIPARYSADDLSGKAACKRELQRRFGLEVDPRVPLVGAVSRFVDQKGMDLLAAALDGILAEMRVQFAVLGSGEKALERAFGALPARHPGRVGSWIGYSDELARWIQAGADFFVMPSRYEPCGLSQIYALRYGTLPVVRATGGLNDTVRQYDERKGEGTGFKFDALTPRALHDTIGWAVSTWYDRPQHVRRMIGAAMAEDFSWAKSAREYVALYERAIALHRSP
jgi:starch synthase